MDDASATRSQTESALTDALARADGGDVDGLVAASAAASESLSSARAAAAEVDAIETERSRVRAEIDAAGSLLDTLRAALADAQAAVTEATGRRDAIVARVERHRDGAATVSERVAALEAHLSALRAVVAADAERARAADAVDEATRAVDAQLAVEGFDTVESAVAARLDARGLERLEARIRAHDEARATAQATLAEPGVSAAPSDPVAVDPARVAKDAAFEARDRERDATAALSRRVEQLGMLVDQEREQRDATAQRRLEFEQLRQLASAVRGDEPNTRRMRLETYVLAAQLEQIVVAANSRLRTMSGGRYTLEHDDALQYRNTKSGLGLAIRDEHTGRARATHSLSGGETFLASLALALGLAEVVTAQSGGITLDTLFIDEGFGSLDADTLEIAMSTLDSLREGGRTIGLISHVEAMKQQIPAKLRVSVSPAGDSSIEETYEPA